ncbi:MAG: hypothetical protein WD065_20310 [Planctomycetaceae bacterium]
MISATMPSMRSMLFFFDGFQLAAASCSTLFLFASDHFEPKLR